MPKLAWIVALGLITAVPAAAETAVPDLRGTWKGNSESVVSGGANPHHATQSAETRFSTIAFTLTVDKQDGRRFSGTFVSARSNDQVVAVIGRNGSIYMADDDGYTVGTLLAPNRIELCYMHSSSGAKVASCTELTKQP
ncbi:MAG TPA: hypothetical protein VH397_06440 [Xanthobacteraceae bacterium]|jgi:hypothetical protein